MIGKIFITRSGYDPEMGKHVKDPYLGANPTLGACRPDVRRQMKEGDHIFVISGKIPHAKQFVMGGFEIDARIPALEAYKQFPDLRLRQLEDGQLTGNIIVDAEGTQHQLDDHNAFDRRIQNYVVGRDLLALEKPEEILRGRQETLDVLQDVMKKKGSSPVEVVGRWGFSSPRRADLSTARVAQNNQGHSQLVQRVSVFLSSGEGAMNNYPPNLGTRQRTLFLQTHTPVVASSNSTAACEIVSVGRRRDGGTRYWCLTHKADATAKYGVPAEQCKKPLMIPASKEDVFTLDLDAYPGGIALWGAVPPVYDTTRFGIDRGIHVHARPAVGGSKSIDRSYRYVRVIGRELEKPGILISEIEAIYYMASSVFGYTMSRIPCTHCGHLHLDKDFFSVNPHRRHLCGNCGRHFQDIRHGVGNPICGIREACNVVSKPAVAPARPLNINQQDCPGGLQIWGTNPSFLWTGEADEEDGIHVHGFSSPGGAPTLDETYSEVVIDGIHLDPIMVRVLMAQMALPSTRERIRSIVCSDCGHQQFDLGAAAHTPAAVRRCGQCSAEIKAPGSVRNVISNPLLAVLTRLGTVAPRTPQRHKLELEPETL